MPQHAFAHPAPWEAAGEDCALLSGWSPLEEFDLAKAAAVRPRLVDGEPAKFAGYVGGWLSVPTRDRQGEVVDPYGIDASWFLADGWFNINHSKDDLEKVGYPVICELREHPEHGPAWWTEGPILDTPRGRQLMTQLRALKNTERQYGFSIQGPKPERDPADPSKLVRTAVWNAAIASMPANWHTRIELVKSLDAAPGLATALNKLAEQDPVAARSLWDHFVAKSLTTGVPTGNVGTDAGAAVQRESFGGAPSGRRRLSLDEAVEYFLRRAKDLGIDPERAVKALADLLTEGASPTA
jgi:hypothetical protein